MTDPRLMTAQEHALIGSTVDKRYHKEPYKPLAVIDGTITVEDCSERRTVEGILGGCIARYYGKKGFGKATLEPLVLDASVPEYGQTIRDPVLKDNLPDNDGYLPDIKDKFPYRRETSEPEDCA